MQQNSICRPIDGKVNILNKLKLLSQIQDNQINECDFLKVHNFFSQRPCDFSLRARKIVASYCTGERDRMCFAADERGLLPTEVPNQARLFEMRTTDWNRK